MVKDGLNHSASRCQIRILPLFFSRQRLLLFQHISPVVNFQIIPLVSVKIWVEENWSIIFSFPFSCFVCIVKMDMRFKFYVVLYILYHGDWNENICIILLVTKPDVTCESVKIFSFLLKWVFGAILFAESEYLILDLIDSLFLFFLINSNRSTFHLCRVILMQLLAFVYN